MMRKKKILFLSSWFPIPADNGSKLRIYNLLRGLSDYYEVSLISFDESPHAERNTIEIKSLCAHISTIPCKHYNPQSLKARLGFLSLSPRVFVDTYSHEMVRHIQETISNQKPDLIIASQLSTALYHRNFQSIPAIFEEVEIGMFYERYSNAKAFKGRLRNGLTWMKHRRYLKKLLHSYQSCTVVSAKEKQLLLGLYPGITNLEIIPNCIDLLNYQNIEAIPQSDTLIFTGSFNYDPNYEGIVWFIEKVLPKLRMQFSSIKLIITGDHAGRSIPPSSNVTLTGYVDDIRSLVASSSISIVPIFSGGGTRLKILEAMALHTPVVTTQKGAEGLEIEHGLNILIADTPDEFAAYILQLLDDPRLRQNLVGNAYRLIQEKYEWSVMMPKFIDLVELTIGKNNPSG